MLGVELLLSSVMSLISTERSSFEGPATTTALSSPTGSHVVMSEESASSPSFVYVVEPSSPSTVNAASSSAANTGSVRRSAADIVGASRIVGASSFAFLRAVFIACDETVAPLTTSTSLDISSSLTFLPAS